MKSSDCRLCRYSDSVTCCFIVCYRRNAEIRATFKYKPSWSEYALSIVMKLSSPYAHKDEAVFLEDGRWLMLYSPRSGGLYHSDNRALVRCMEERIPIGVFKQLTGKTDRYYGSTYRVLGLGLITSYDIKADVFVVESADSSALEQVSSVITDEESRYEVQLYAQLT